MKYLIVGDSQAQGAGSVLAGKLKKQGHDVTLTAKHGAGSAEVLQLAQAQAGKPFDVVVVFSGSTAGGAPAAAGIPKLFSSSKIYWYGSGPATTIKSLPLAQAVFGKHVKTANHWFTSGEAAAREARNQAMPSKLPSWVVYVDWRKLSWPAGAFPQLGDGIHVDKPAAEVAFSDANWPPRAGGAIVQVQGGWAVLGIGLLVWIAHRQGWFRWLA